MAAQDCALLVKDYRAMSLIAANAIVEGTVDKTIEVKFTEAIDSTAGIAALMANDLVIKKADGTTLVAGLDYTTAIKAGVGNENILVVTGTGAGFTAQTYTVASIAAPVYMRDDSAQLNKAAAFTTATNVVVD